MVQWTPYTKYTNWATSSGYLDPSEMDTALDRIIYELNNRLQWIPKSQFNNMSFREFSTSLLTPEYLAQVFVKSYERPANPNQPARSTQARQWFDFLGGITPIPPSEPIKTKFKWVLYARKLRRQ